MSRERDIRNAVQDAVSATGEFDAVWQGGLVDPRGQAASEWKGLGIEPASTSRGTGYDAETGGGWVYECRIDLEIVVRNDDTIARDEEAERLLNVVRNVAYGSLGGLTLAQRTYVDSWRWLRPVPPERRIRCVLAAPYLEEGELDADVSP